MIDVINHSTGKNYTTTHKVKQFMLSGTFDSGFALQLMTKDVGMAIQMGQELGVDTQLGPEVLKIWSAAASALAKSADHTEMYRYILETGTSACP